VIESRGAPGLLDRQRGVAGVVAFLRPEIHGADDPPAGSLMDNSPYPKWTHPRSARRVDLVSLIAVLPDFLPHACGAETRNAVKPHSLGAGGAVHASRGMAPQVLAPLP